MATRDASYLLDIYDSARFAEEFVTGIERESFLHDRMRQSAVIRELAIIGEAVKKVSPESGLHIQRSLGERWPAWDILVHDYRGTNLNNVWFAATESIPALIDSLQPLIPEAEDLYL